ncbi:MAG: bifunctional riboflavin kinase/FAD synthetase [Candidatus Brocadia sp.]|uniref:Riboflavin biosynthesis protein n=1 Tax=Candidatus Brocadia fulgida TaxID=380242 RepID=A0A0M2UZ15_9BACT|nr:MAG: riboflavin biosynthesis protein [Candidatus Brocadia fulgida]UJS20787.1 MAG: bifunctional riboflavin kinase/FAD synthetase [Candidatus Brocadia sp.]
METIYGVKTLTRKIPYPVATIGMFDGVHRGHKRIIEEVLHHALTKHGESVIITFNRHPKNVLENRPPSFITSLEHRLKLFSNLGVDHTVVIPFDKTFAHISAEDFIREIMVGWLGVKCIILGFNCRFGRDREGNIHLVRRLAATYGFEVYECPPAMYQGRVISSTAIRQAILNGELETAERMLGRPVSILGTVVRKSGRGKTLGYPTANLDLHHEVRPPRGVYGTKLCWAGHDYLALTNIGMRPTFAREPFTGEDERLEVEVHILDFHENIYGQNLEVQFLFKIRDEMPFTTSEELKSQIERDEEDLLKNARLHTIP